jgi:hypothetical protein
MYRDFIYLNIDRLQSILAQLQEGLLDQVIEENTEEYSGGGRITANLVSLLIPLSALLLQVIRSRPTSGRLKCFATTPTT